MTTQVPKQPSLYDGNARPPQLFQHAMERQLTDYVIAAMALSDRTLPLNDRRMGRG
ncbi:hypothetical protein [Nitratireductor rhodophyticola]|uniref:hypothetical protein n=1 Tax=Nitratireductor rhodophyticola TaxID=2854036 RepID=UPI001CA76C66|nr:hypothetical protein [Nitratireductor rhodophyticola]